MVDEDNKKNISDDAESTKWPPPDAFDDEPEISEAPNAEPEETPATTSSKKSFLDHAKSNIEETPKPIEETVKPEASDKPSFLNLSGELKGEAVSEEKEEELSAEANEEDAFPWEMDSAEPERESEIPKDEESLSALFTESEPPVENKKEESAEELSSPEKSEEDVSPFAQAFFDQGDSTEEIPADSPSDENSKEEPQLALGGSGDGTDDFLSSLQDDPNEDDDGDDSPYRAYAYYDFIQSELNEDTEKGGLQLNKQAIILIIALLIVGGWFGYQKFAEGRYDFTAKRERRKEPRRTVISRFEEPAEKLPIWAISRQKPEKSGAEQEVILAALENSGRDNPFAVPDAVLSMVKQDIESKIADEKPPEVYTKTAYRGTLVGVIKSVKGMLAVVSLRTAIFDVTEGTSKPKIIKEAIKQMQRAQDDSLEVIEGDSVGPWTIEIIEDGRDTGLEAKMMIKRGDEIKELRIGVPVDLGIYNDQGELDVYKEGEEDEA